jgi:predicted ATPase
VCQRLDGIPLALELAAALVRGLAVEDIAARLDQRFWLLTSGGRAALPRQQTLRATIEWSFNLLSASERALFCRLSVFAGRSVISHNTARVHIERILSKLGLHSRAQLAAWAVRRAGTGPRSD